MRLSVLISVYAKESPLFLQSALNSIWDQQTLKPSEIVIVKDGPLTESLDVVIKSFSIRAPVKLVLLHDNMGLGVALSKGVAACSNEIIARMDSDDIAAPERFRKQTDFLALNPDTALLSSNIAEFKDNSSEICGIRKVPQKPEDIAKFAKTRNPMNHMAVIFKKSAVLNSGNYQSFHGYEDYYLWVRMLSMGYEAANLHENLVFARIGNNMIARRQGVRFFKEEIRLQKKFYIIGFINSFQLIRNILLRGLPRLMPIFALTIIYKILRK